MDFFRSNLHSKLLLGVALLPLVFSCSIPQKLDPEKFYKRDMKLVVNGFKGTGTLVVPRAAKYAMEIHARADLDLFTFESCHREITKEDAGEGGIFGDGKKVEMEFIPVKGKEDIYACPIRFGGYERSKGRHSWAILDFEGPDATLPARVKCNGAEYDSRGVTICQSREGLIQEIKFPVEVIVNPDPGCPMERPADLKTYVFTMPEKECVFNFMEKGEARREHRLTTVGYEDIMIREN